MKQVLQKHPETGERNIAEPLEGKLLFLPTSGRAWLVAFPRKRSGKEQGSCTRPERATGLQGRGSL